jgi:hypothetical protein
MDVLVTSSSIGVDAGFIAEREDKSSKRVIKDPDRAAEGTGKNGNKDQVGKSFYYLAGYVAPCGDIGHNKASWILLGGVFARFFREHVQCSFGLNGPIGYELTGFFTR